MTKLEELQRLLEAATEPMPALSSNALERAKQRRSWQDRVRFAQAEIVDSAPALLACARALGPFAKLAAGYEGSKRSPFVNDLRAAAQALADLEAGE